jgi:hypothetical protein
MTRPDGFAGPVHAFLAGVGLDHRGRSLDDILAFDDQKLEAVHDFIQWLFPLREASRAVPGAPVLTADEAEAIRGDARAVEGLRRAAERMLGFYGATDDWLVPFEHNHLRITRIVSALRDLAGEAEARAFYDVVSARNQAAGGPISPGNLAYWRRALESPRSDRG